MDTFLHGDGMNAYEAQSIGFLFISPCSSQLNNFCAEYDNFCPGV